jgi:Rrf2 family transcriptional regulator, iron-sulfur cluster assembly transcription factor
MISKSCQYAIRAAVYLASRADENLKLNVKAIAKEIDAPEAFTAKTLQILNKHNIITSLKGPYGGFFIEEYQLDVPILNIVNAIDGLQIFKSCGLGLKKCSEANPCPFHNDYKILREAMLSTFEKTTIRILAHNLENGDPFLLAGR